MPRLTTLTQAHIGICDNTLRSRGMIAPNRAIVAAIILTSPTLVRCLGQYYKGVRPEGTLDTYERGYLLDALADNYCKGPWPCNMDGDDVMQRFSDTLVEKASEAGWVFTDTH